MLFELRDGLTRSLRRDAVRTRSLPDAAEFDGLGKRRDGLEVVDGHGQFFR
jgi:hypothetical protein